MESTTENKNTYSSSTEVTLDFKYCKVTMSSSNYSRQKEKLKQGFVFYDMQVKA